MSNTTPSATKPAELAQAFYDIARALDELSKDSALTHAMGEVERRFGLVGRMERADQLSRQAGKLRTCCQNDLFYMCMKLLAESGELAGSIEDFFGRYDRLDKLTGGDLEKVKSEYGDVLVMLLRIGKMFEIDPCLAIDAALDKYQKRIEEVQAERVAIDAQREITR